MTEQADQIAADLAGLQEQLDGLLTPLDEEGWATPTPSVGWTVRDQISHLAFFEDSARLAVTDPDRFAEQVNTTLAMGVEPFMAIAVDRGRALPHSAVLEWWQRSRAASLEAFRTLGPDDRVPWYGPRMAAATFVAARVMETWAHGLDVAEALGSSLPAGAALRHVALLGVKTFSWSFQNRGLPVPASRVKVELTGPSGAVHRWNEEAEESVSGDLEDFCRVVTQRCHVDDTGLLIQGETARLWMEVAQCFAGPPGPGRQPGVRNRGETS